MQTGIRPSQTVDFILKSEKVKHDPRLDIFSLWTIPKTQGAASALQHTPKKISMDEQEYDYMNEENSLAASRAFA